MRRVALSLSLTLPPRALSLLSLFLFLSLSLPSHSRSSPIPLLILSLILSLDRSRSLARSLAPRVCLQALPGLQAPGPKRVVVGGAHLLSLSLSLSLSRSLALSLFRSLSLSLFPSLSLSHSLSLALSLSLSLSLFSLSRSLRVCARVQTAEGGPLPSDTPSTHPGLPRRPGMARECPRSQPSLSFSHRPQTPGMRIVAR